MRQRGANVSELLLLWKRHTSGGLCVPALSGSKPMAPHSPGHRCCIIFGQKSGYCWRRLCVNMFFLSRAFFTFIPFAYECGLNTWDSPTFFFIAEKGYWVRGTHLQDSKTSSSSYLNFRLKWLINLRASVKSMRISLISCMQNAELCSAPIFCLLSTTREPDGTLPKIKALCWSWNQLQKI